MSYWSQRRAAERTATGTDLRSKRGNLATHDGFGVERGRAGASPHPATVTSPRRSLVQRAAHLEQTIWIVPPVADSETDPLHPGRRVTSRAAW